MSRTEKLNRLLKALEVFAKADDQELIDSLPEEYELLAPILDYTNKFEKELTKLFKKQNQYYIDGLKNTEIQKAEHSDHILSKLFAVLVANDPTPAQFRSLARRIINKSVDGMTELAMSIIDKDVSFNQNTTLYTKSKIEDYYYDLGDYLQVSNMEALKGALIHGLDNGWGIDKIADKISKLPQFSRTRARTVAITEVLTASSIALQEAYIQSPSVEGKKWKHSGARKNTPRPAHVALSGTVIGVNDDFEINGYWGAYPRDPKFPASERVRCHCVLGPAVNEEIFGLSKAEKEEIRNAVLEGREPNLKPKALSTLEANNISVFPLKDDALNSLTKGNTKLKDKLYDPSSPNPDRWTKDNHKIDKEALEYLFNGLEITEEGLANIYNPNPELFDIKLAPITGYYDNDNGELALAELHLLLFEKGTDNSAGFIRRNIVKRDGEVYIKNDYFELSKKYQGLGGAIKSYYKCDQLYKEMAQGNKVTISLLANIDVGCYAWSRHGFDFEDKDIAVKLRADVQKAILQQLLDDISNNKIPSLSSASSQEKRDYFNNTYLPSFLEKNGYNSIEDITHSWQFAALDSGVNYELPTSTPDKYREGHLGKLLLLKLGSWDGKKYINAAHDSEKISNFYYESRGIR